MTVEAIDPNKQPNNQQPGEPSEPLAGLRRFAVSAPPVERCELCASALDDPHPHLLDCQTRRIVCSCDACAILFSNRQDGKYRRIPRRVRAIRDLAMSGLDWEALAIPINLAFFFRNSIGQVKAMYPSPAGVIESQLAMDSRSGIFATNPIIVAMEPEVEALLVNRIGTAAMAFVVPIDACYRLAGLIRMKWHGLSGGAQVWGAIAEFFQELEHRAGGEAQRA